MESQPALDQGDLFATVVAGGYCIGCGACAAVSAKIEMAITPFGMYEAALKRGEALTAPENRLAGAVCPFSAHAGNEDQLADPLYSGYARKHAEIGYHAQCFSGHVAEGTYRAEGSSGGMGTWLASELLRLGLVDGIVHVRPNRDPASTPGMLFEFAVSRSAETLRQGAHSHYYPVTLARVLSHIKADPGVRYALVGIPCFIKAARLLSRQDAALCDAIRFYIGLVCGHLKSTGFAQLLGWQSGIDPGSLVGVDFRDKLAGRSPRHYGFRAIGRTRAADIDIARPMSEVFGADWGLGFFKYKACDFCDDVFAETADVVVGDAWLPQFDHDWQGTNILIVRHPIFADILAAAAAESRISIAPLSADQAAASQRSGLRHRREGLSARIHAARDRGEWHPPKRVAAGADNIPRMRRRLYELRELMRTASHEAFAEARRRNDLAFFTERMAPMVKQYYDHFKPGMGHRVVNRLKRLWAAWQRETEPR